MDKDFTSYFEQADQDGLLDYNSAKERKTRYDLLNVVFYFWEQHKFPEEQINNFTGDEEYLVFIKFLEEEKGLNRIKKALTATDKIDTVLKHFVSGLPMKTKYSLGELNNVLVYTQGLMLSDDLERCLKQLVNDSMIRKNKKNPELIRYEITWDGEFFHEAGGYAKDINLDLAVKKAPIAMKKMQIVMTILTIILAITSAISAYYYILLICTDKFSN